MNKFKKITISLLISGAITFCFTACGGGGGGSGGGDSGTVEDGDSSSSSSGKIDSTWFVGKDMIWINLATGKDWTYSFRSNGVVTLTIYGGGSYNHYTGTYSTYNGTSKSVTIDVKVKDTYIYGNTYREFKETWSLRFSSSDEAWGSKIWDEKYYLNGSMKLSDHGNCEVSVIFD